LHLDCEGRSRELLPVPCEIRHPKKLGSVARGQRLFVASEKHLFVLNAVDATIVRTIAGWDADPCWRLVQLATDTRNRVALLCRHLDDKKRWAVFVLDADGDALDRIDGPQQQLQDRPNDVAISAAAVWLAADDGLWRVDASEASMARESESVIVTPVLLSPQSDAGRGWLRAELDMELPLGAALEVDFASTNVERVANEAIRIGTDRSLGAARRQALLWDALDVTRSAVFRVTAAHAAGQPISIPLFETEDRWLWLRIKVVAPPGTAAKPIKALRVVYPDATLMRYLPSVFRGSEYDPTGFLRALVGVLETTTQGIDDRIRAIGAHIDPDTAPIEWLDYLARWLDLPWDDALPSDAKRRILQQAGLIVAARGTRRGLQLLLNALIGSRASARIVDLTVDHAPLRLGGHGCTGSPLPVLLAGASPAAPILGSKAVLGRACLGVPCDPLRCVVPTVRIELTASRAVHAALAPVLEHIVAQYVPAAMKVTAAWRLTSAFLASIDRDEGDVLDGVGPGALGSDSEIGRTVLGGRGVGRLDDLGLDLGFRLS
jgi:phage tail-like protein